MKQLTYSDFIDNISLKVNKCLILCRNIPLIRITNEQVDSLQLYYSNMPTVTQLLDDFYKPFIVVQSLNDFKLSHRLTTYVKFNENSHTIECMFDRQHTLYKLNASLYYQTVNHILEHYASM